MELPEHLGGHLEKTHVDGGTLRHLKRVFNLQSMIDVGCSVGDMVRVADDIGMDAEGVDGDWTLKPYWDQKQILVRVHDFVNGPLDLPDQAMYDLGWCVEFLEHVDQQYMDNYMQLFQHCKYVVCTAAPPTATGGHHHVNLQDQSYWVQKFDEYGFEFDPEMTEKIRRISTMKKPFMQTTGMFFRRKGV